MKKFVFIISALISCLCLSMSAGKNNGEQVAKYYDKQLVKLLSDLCVLQKSITENEGKPRLRSSFLACRSSYKSVEFFVDVFDPYKAKQLNGPDVVRADEDNPQDPMYPHGLQVMETLLYGGTFDKKKLLAETDLAIQTVTKLRNDPDRVYYFTDDKVWQCMRLGVYRVISLGITGFDVPLCYHALPESRIVLAAVHKAAACYKDRIGKKMAAQGDTLFNKADAYIAANNNFNSFDRIVFIRDYADKISDWLTECAKQQGLINPNDINAINASANNLFAPDIMNLRFFSPNEQYKLTPERVALGKKLFYDTRLSGNNSRSCASCHDPQKGFADGLPKPTDLSGEKILPRNTPTLLNAALQMRQFYDSRSETLEGQLNAVVHNADEMNGSLINSVPRLAADKEYLVGFQKAYPDAKEPVTAYHIGNAIASYVRSLVSLNSRFDKYIRHQANDLSGSEKNGFNLFMGKAKCGTCHYAPVFNGLTPPAYQETESEILGVPSTDKPVSAIDPDLGKFCFTQSVVHRYAFKTPTVRNVALTAPYMHNGVFKTLDDVISFYNDGGGAGRGIDLSTQTLPTEKLHLTKKEIKDIVAFLGSLTDTSGTTFGYYHIR